MTNWTERHCKACEGDVAPMTDEEIQGHLKALDGWTYEEGMLVRTFSFKNYYQTTAFVNAVVWIAHREDHHPDVTFGYKTCTVKYATHSIGGISDNDFICAARADALLEGPG